jgi:hypothetical protein
MEPFPLSSYEYKSKLSAPTEGYEDVVLLMSRLPR